MEHVLRHNANPKESYKDGRVDKILLAIEELAMGLTKFEDGNWKRLTESAIKIFKDEDALAKKKEQELSWFIILPIKTFLVYTYYYFFI